MEAQVAEVLASPVVLAATEFCKAEMEGNDPSHDFPHVQRVLRNALKILHEEKGEGATLTYAVVLGAILHDVGDYKYSGSMEAGPARVRSFLQSQNCAEDVIEKVAYIVANISYSKELSGGVVMTPELAIVQDADRLDAIGAIGVARTFSYGARKGTVFHDPEIGARGAMTTAEYTQTPAARHTTLNHFDEKLFKLAGMMKTETGRRLAQRRHEFMQQFVQEFLGEWA